MIAKEAVAYSKFKRFYRKHRGGVIAFCILTPMILWWIASSGFAMLFGFVLGFFEWKQIGAVPKFIWFDNFIAFFSDESYLQDLWRTIWLGVSTTMLSVIFGFLAALFMNLPLKGKGVFRSLWYLPAVTSSVAVTQILGIFLDPINGYINNLLISFGQEPIVLSSSLFWSVVMILLYSVWKNVGGTALVWLAGLQSIDPALYEAAEVDGAGRWKKFLHVTLPGLRPIATYVIITHIIGALQIYESVAFISNGGPFGQTNVLALRIIQDGFFNFNFGMAGASSMVLAVIIFVSSLTYYKLSRRGLKEEI